MLFISLAGCSSSPTEPPPDGKLSPADSLALLRETFNPPEDCAPCHPNHYNEWRTSMHAYVITDPVFLTLSKIGQQRSGNQLDQFCVKCHSPVGSLLGETPPGFGAGALSNLARAGVQCDVCHKMAESEPGKGIIQFHLENARYGPLPDPQNNPFHESRFDRRFIESSFCSGCHDVLSPENLLIERTSTEWDESAYASMGLECQDCHMPKYEGQAATGGPTRRDLHRHRFIGVDVPLVDFPGRDETMAAVAELLQNAATLEVDAPARIAEGAPLEIVVAVKNDLTGHNIPSGTIFERQMWIELMLVDGETDELLLASGQLDANGDLLNNHSDFVSNGTTSLDQNLFLMHGVPYRNGEEILFFWEADSIADFTVPPFTSRSRTYRLAGDQLPTGTLELSVRLRFRSFPPYFLRAIGESRLAAEVPIFEMETFSTSIQVTQ